MHFLLASPSVNNVTITGDYTLPDGSQVLLVSEVLFVSESVVSRLHQVQLTFQLPLTLNEKDSGLFFLLFPIPENCNFSLKFQMHRDKETPPLLAFPWFGAQFLSHSFLALERDPRFTIVTK